MSLSFRRLTQSTCFEVVTETKEQQRKTHTEQETPIIHTTENTHSKCITCVHTHSTFITCVHTQYIYHLCTHAVHVSPVYTHSITCCTHTVHVSPVYTHSTHTVPGRRRALSRCPVVDPLCPSGDHPASSCCCLLQN